MTVTELLIRQVLRMPYLISHPFYIRCPFLDRMFVEAIETGLVDQVYRSLLRMADGQGRVRRADGSICLHL